MKMVGQSRKQRFLLVGAVIVVMFLGALIAFNGRLDRPALRPTGGATFAKAVVEEVMSSNLDDSDVELQGNQTVELRITSGAYKGQTCEATSPYANQSGAKCVPGLRVIALVNTDSEGNLVATVYNYDRGMVLWGLIALFLVILCLIG